VVALKGTHLAWPKSNLSDNLTTTVAIRTICGPGVGLSSWLSGKLFSVGIISIIGVGESRKIQVRGQEGFNSDQRLIRYSEFELPDCG
jgi:hypothetical protein